jgi:FkbM family methyltransferase
MSATLMEAASHRVGTMRFGRHAIPGRGRLADAIGKLAGWIGGGHGVASPWPGVRFETDLTDRIQRQMWAGVYEPHVRECFNAILEPGAVYFDVGAHIGFHAVFAAHRVGPEGRVFAFEADPRVYERLSRNLSQFRWSQAVNAAVWDRTGSLTFERSPTKNESGWGSVSAVRDFGTGEHVEVPSVALDDWFYDLHLERWDAMKLDAEGSELAVLRGAQNLLEEFRPSLILEINNTLLEQGGISPSGVADFLLERNYRLFWLEFRRLEPWDPAKHMDFCEALCLPGEHAAGILKRLARGGFEQAQ